MNELKDTINQIAAIMEYSDRSTKSTVESIKLIESNITSTKSRLDEFFKTMDERKLRLSNLNKSVLALDQVYRLIKAIDDDEAYIAMGPQGSLDEYIKELDDLKSLSTFLPKGNNRYYRTKAKQILKIQADGQRILTDEFQNIIKHYSCPESVYSFINYITNELLNDNLEINEEEITNGSNNNNKLFISYETLKKLRMICDWFLNLEEQYELYNDKQEHCDVLEKFKYTEIRFEFIKQITRSYLKLNSTEIIQQPHSPKITSRNKMLTLGNHYGSPTFHKVASTNSISQLAFSNNHRLLNKDTEKEKETSNVQKIRKIASNNLIVEKINSLIMDESNNKLFFRRNHTLTNSNSLTRSRGIECIEMFCENLNFCLKILKHEKVLINYIFESSPDTRSELLQNLTVLIIEEIQNEFDVFLTHGCDFKKSSNIGSHVVNAIIDLVMKVKKLKENTNGLELFDLPCASKMLNFSNRLNEITGEILFYYLDSVRHGYFNKFQFPPDCSIHDFCEETCEIMSNIRSNEQILDSAMKILFETYLNDTSHVDEQFQSAEHPNFYSHLDDKYQKDLFEDESLREKSVHFAKYYWLLIQRLNTFLIDDAIKASTTTASTYSAVGSAKNNIVNLKAYIFLLNNLEHVVNIAKKLNLLDSFRFINDKFDTMINESIDRNCEKACEIFEDIYLKWQSLSKAESVGDMNLTVSNDSLNNNKKFKHRLSIFEKRASISPLKIGQSKLAINSVNSVSSAASAAKKAFKSFKNTMLNKQRSVSEDFEDQYHHDIIDTDAVKITQINPFQSMKHSITIDKSELDSFDAIHKGLDNIKKRRYLIQELTLALEISTKIVIINPNLNTRFKKMVSEYLNPVFDALIQTGELQEIAKKIFSYVTIKDSEELKTQIIDEMFPNYKL